MSNLQYFLNIVTECHKHEATLLKKSLRFCINTSDKIRIAYKEHNIRHLYDIGVLDFNGLEETQTSELIKLIFAYENEGKHPLWLSFIETFYPDKKDLLTSTAKPIFSTEKQHIDICVEEKGKYVFIFENKLKGALFQRNQLGRYIYKMCEKYKIEDIFLVIIPGWIDNNFIEYIRTSAWKVPKDWDESNNARKCCNFNSKEPHACWCDDKDWEGNEWCQSCKDYKQCCNYKIIDKEFTDWLLNTANSTIIPQDEYLLRSAMIQFAHYIKGLYHIRLNIKEIMENIEILSKELALNPQNPEECYNKVTQTIKELKDLEQSLSRLQAILKVQIWQKEIEDYFTEARVVSDKNSFSVLIEDIDTYCGVWVEDDNRPYWGFYRNKISTEEAKETVRKIIEKTSASSKTPVNDFLAWDYTQHGSERIKSFLEAAEKLGHKYQRK